LLMVVAGVCEHPLKVFRKRFVGPEDSSERRSSSTPTRHASSETPRAACRGLRR
jgi:hypothetical protein